MKKKRRIVTQQKDNCTVDEDKEELLSGDNKESNFMKLQATIVEGIDNQDSDWRYNKKIVALYDRNESLQCKNALNLERLKEVFKKRKAGIAVERISRKGS